MNETATTKTESRLAVGVPIIAGHIISTGTPLAEAWILDAGCGQGSYTQALVKMVGHVDAVDPQGELPDETRAYLARYERAGRLSLHAASLAELPFEEGTFDAVVVNQVLWHLENGAAGHPMHRRALAEFFRVLRPGGVVIVNASTHRQIREGFWFHTLIPGAVEVALRKSMSASALKELLTEIGYQFDGRTVPLDLTLREDGYRDAASVLDPAAREGASIWRFASETETREAMVAVRALEEEGRLADFIAERERSRERVGQFTFFVGRKPD
jgi:SAM-dependent methyltransferase